MIELANLPLPGKLVGCPLLDWQPTRHQRRECLRWLIRYWRDIGDGGLRGGRAKEIIRSVMRVIDTAHRVTVVGVKCTGMHCVNSPGHISHIAGVPAATSGVRYEYQLMFEASVDGNLVACVPEYTWWLSKKK